jgi:aldehyde:ferredoxin oxidoreductase
MADEYGGKILFVDLSQHDCREESTEKWQHLIGGRVLGSFLLASNPNLKCDSPADQPIVISAGPLVGVNIPLGVRTNVSARHQVTGGMSYSNVGGDFGTRLRMAGYDAILIEGASDQPVYLLVQENGASILTAQDLWGLKVSQLQEALFEKHGKEYLGFIGIGPGGENQLPISCLMVGRAHAAGWGGTGAIFGAKNLKAIVAIGSKPVKVFDPRGLERKGRQIEWRLRASEPMDGLVTVGTHGLSAGGGIAGKAPIGVRNLQDEYMPPEEVSPIREKSIRDRVSGRAGCVGCTIRCLKIYELQSEHYGRWEIEGMHANSVRGLGTNLGVTNPEDLLMLHYTVNEMGLNVDGVSAALAFALECAEKGLLERDQPGGVHLDWGSGPSLVKLVQQMVESEGLGTILSGGAFSAAQKIGKGSERYAMTVKKVGINESKLHTHRAWAIGIMTSTRGGGHLGGAPQVEMQHVSSVMAKRLLGNPHAAEPISYVGKGKMAAQTDVYKAIIDAMGLCYFAYGWMDVAFLNMDEVAELFTLTTGVEVTEKELYQLGLRCHTMERFILNKLSGISRRDDWVSDRFFDEPVSDGPYKGEHLDRDQLEKSLDEYYETLGWDVESGLPTTEKLEELDLAFLLNI